MKLLFNQNNLKPPKKWSSANPFVLIGRDYLLVDDIVHKAINKPAERIAKETGLSKRMLAYTTLGAGAFASGVVFYDEPLKAMNTIIENGKIAIAIVFITIPFKKIADKFSLFLFPVSRASMHALEDTYKIFLKAWRFPALVVSTICLLGNDHKISQGISLLSLAIAIYLFTSDWGMLDRFRNALKDLKEGFVSQTASVEVES